MQKKLIALAVASLASGAAFAQTNVTMYGIADAGYVYSSGSNNDFSGMVSGLLSGSRLGFRGEEALGNGLKAVFTLEYSLDITNNSGVGYADGGTLNSRQQFVGLAGNWGTVALGRQYAPGYQATTNNDPFAGAAFSPASYLTRDAKNSITPNSAARWNNAATFTSANYGGFSFKGIYAFGEYSENTGAKLGEAEGLTAAAANDRRDNIWDDGAYGLGANYANGPLNLDAVWQSRQYRRTTWTGSAKDGDFSSSVNGKDTNEWYVGGSFDLKVVKLMASYQDQDDKNTPNLDSDTWQVGATMPIGAVTIAASYAQTSFDSGGTKSGYDGDSQAFAIGAMYNLSKRTTVYAGYVWGDNDDDGMPAAPVSATGFAGDSSNTFLAGVRHSF